ncbi:MAG: adenylyltransferase/cytidyltransferase family protein, partial [Intrasporangiaceae bacterium]|nr:adenylyltransferase/cytidyltransferase family protein [Intrasporangiaceae bacterium]
MPDSPARAAIVSGYFNPLHIGHLQMMEAASELGDGHLVVIVNSDAQQELKKGRVIFDEDVRLRIVRALRVVDDAIVAVDSDGSVTESLRRVRDAYPDTELVFC